MSTGSWIISALIVLVLIVCIMNVDLGFERAHTLFNRNRRRAPGVRPEHSHEASQADVVTAGAKIIQMAIKNGEALPIEALDLDDPAVHSYFVSYYIYFANGWHGTGNARIVISGARFSHETMDNVTNWLQRDNDQKLASQHGKVTGVTLINIIPIPI